MKLAAAFEFGGRSEIGGAMRGRIKVEYRTAYAKIRKALAFMKSLS